MLFIKTTPETNGAHANLCLGNIENMPAGYAVVRDDLEQKAMPLLPWVKLTISNGIITAIEDDAVARAAWEALPKPAPEQTVEETTLELLADQEYRLCNIELGLNK